MLVYKVGRIHDTKLGSSTCEEVMSYRMYIEGDTYESKEALRNLGYKWSNDCRCWEKELAYLSMDVTEDGIMCKTLQLIERAEGEIASLAMIDEVRESKLSYLAKIKDSMDMRDASNLKFFDYKEIKTRKQLNQQNKYLHDMLKIAFPLVDTKWIRDTAEYKEHLKQREEYEKTCKPIEEEYDIVWHNFAKFKKGLLQK